ncbi:M67 family metallopeptidase [Sphingomonas sp. JC676]|uniref:Mov34/MPN/PAD-1 family protein n=1 Tax=Sphingomonas sp. JC676 TaxID=2768065 RepID=UPI0016576BAE|nr:M67 family metallopeptidase [Sphingomonas sp. JC676]MBC9031228.1 M67 family metallopeptidase [Sphingomonas sp. JC676]
MRIAISRSVLIGIRRFSADAAPKEACGLLFGEGDAITGFQATENVAETPEIRFEIDPRALFAALKAERAGGPKIAGYWHSHPSGDATPSATDATMAAPDGKLWVIVTGEAVTAWKAGETGAHGRFREIELTAEV